MNNDVSKIKNKVLEKNGLRRVDIMIKIKHRQLFKKYYTFSYILDPINLKYENSIIKIKINNI